MAKRKKKVAIYIRVSTVEQSENDFSSLDGKMEFLMIEKDMSMLWYER